MSNSQPAGFHRRGLMGAAGAVALTGFPNIGFTQPRQPIKIGVPTILSGRVAQLGISSRNAMQIEVDAFNAAGGLDGRMIELIVRDSRGVPAEAARIAREMITSDAVDFLFDAEPSSGGFAIHEVVRETGTASASGTPSAWRGRAFMTASRAATTPPMWPANATCAAG